MPNVRLLLFLLLCLVEARAQVNVMTTPESKTSPPGLHYTLNQCLEYAYQHQKNMVNSTLDVEIAKAKIRETIGIGLPQVSASGQYLYYPKIPVTLFPDFISPLVYGVLQDKGVKDGNGNVITVPQGPTRYTPVSFALKNAANIGVDVSQILFDGTYLVGLQATKVYRELSVKGQVQTKIQTTVSVSKAYYNILVGAEQLHILEADSARLGKNYSDTKALNANGLAEKIDVSRIEVQLNNILTQKTKASRLLALGLFALKYQMGMPLETPLLVDGEVKSLALPVVADTSFFDPAGRIEYSLQRTQVRLYALDAKRSKFTSLPTLSAIGEYRLAFQNNSLNKLFNTSYPQAYIGLNLNIPIFSGLQRANRYQQAKLTLKKSENDLAELGKSLQLELKNAQTAYLNNRDALVTQQKNQDLAKEIYRVTKIKYEQGIGSSLEVTTAETDLKNAETNYLSALFDVLIAKVDLDKAAGTLIPN